MEIWVRNEKRQLLYRPLQTNSRILKISASVRALLEATENFYKVLYNHVRAKVCGDYHGLP